MSIVIRAHDLNASLLSASAAEKTATGWRSFVSYKEARTPLIVQTPKLNVSCNVLYGDKLKNFGDKTKTTASTPTMALSFRNKGRDPGVNDFLQKLRDVDAFILAQAKQNAATWFPNNKQIHSNPEALSILHSQLVKTTFNKTVADKEYPESIWVKLDGVEKEGKLESDVGVFLGSRNTPKTVNDIEKGMDAIALLRFGPIWITPTGMFGITIYLVQIKLFPTKLLPDYAFIDDDDDEAAQSSPATATSSTAATCAIDQPPCSPVVSASNESQGLDTTTTSTTTSTSSAQDAPAEKESDPQTSRKRPAPSTDEPSALPTDSKRIKTNE